MSCCVRCARAMPAGVKVTVVADRGFGNGPMFQYLSEELGFEYVIRLRGDIYVTSATGWSDSCRAGFAPAR